jgi:O-antigen/teichoic acid export membrane protein
MALARAKALLFSYRRELVGATMEGHSMVLGLITSILLARGLGVTDFGTFASFQAVVFFGLAIMRFGAPPLIVREIAAALSTGKLGTVRGMTWVSDRYVWGLAVLVGGIAGGAFVVRDAAEATLFATGLGVAYLWAALSILDGVSRGFGGVLLGRTAELVVRPLVLAVALGTIFIFSNQITLTVAIALFAASILAAALFSIVVRLLLARAEGLREATPEMNWRPWGKSLVQLGAIGILSTLSVQLEVLMLTLLATPEEVGLYRAASQIGLLPAVGLGIVNLQLAPQFSAALARGDRAVLQALARRSSRFALALGLPIVLIALVAADPLVRLLYGADFAAAAPSMRILALGQVVQITCGSAALIHISARYERNVLTVTLVIFLLGILLNVILIPFLGVTGAAVSHALGLLLWSVALVWSIWIKLGVVSLPFNLRFGSSRS